MKAIFTYPSNSSTYYIDPQYYGDATSGFYKRVDDLKDGDYRSWSSTAPTESVENMISVFAKYHNAYEEDSGNSTFYQWWYNPMIEARLRAKEELVADFSIDIDGTTPKLRVDWETTTSNVDGARIYPFGHRTNEFEGAEFYYQDIDGDTGHISNDSGGTVWVVNELLGTKYDTSVDGGSLTSTSIRNGSGSLILFPAAVDWTSDTVIQLITSFTDPSDTGTLNQTSTPFYINRISNSRFEVFTDSAKTIPATLNEHYIQTGTDNFAVAGTYNLTNQDFADYGITDLSQLSAEAEGFCRITATVNSGTFTGADDSTKTIGTSKSFSQDFYWQYNVGGLFDVFDIRGDDKTFADFIIGGATPDVDIAIEFIDPARTSGGWCRYLSNDTTDAGMSLSDSLANTYEVHYYRFATYGNRQFRYQDAENVTQTGAKFLQQYWLAGDTSATPIGSDTMPPDSSPQLDLNGRLFGINLPSGISNDRGIFASGDSRLFQLVSADDLYVDPGQTVAEQQDNWDTNSRWQSTNYTDANKAWPRHVSPASAILRYDMPSTVTKSQGGTKYVRGSGFTRWQLEVTYPPMTQEQFRKFHTTAQLAQGQYIPFLFELRDKNGNNILFDYHNPASITTCRIKRDNIVDSAVLLEGFPSFLSDALKEGELIICDEDNGRVNTIAVDQDANAYGEVWAQFTFPASGTQTAGNFAYLDPFHVVVTLADNGFEYSVDTAGLHYITVRFDWDEWK